MPLTLPDNDSALFSVIGTDSKGVKGASLPTGAKLVVTSSDPNTVVVNQDATAQPAADGTPTVGSGNVQSAATPAAPNTPITITAQVVLADGSNGDSITDTVTVAPGTETAVGILFGAALPVSASAKKKLS